MSVVGVKRTSPICALVSANDPKPKFSPSQGDSEIRGVGFGRPSRLATLLSFVVPLHVGLLTVGLRFWRLHHKRGARESNRSQVRQS
jgi:hypothetical protein